MSPQSKHRAYQPLAGPTLRRQGLNTYVTSCSPTTAGQCTAQCLNAWAKPQQNALPHDVSSTQTSAIQCFRAHEPLQAELSIAWLCTGSVPADCQGAHPRRLLQPGAPYLACCLQLHWLARALNPLHGLHAQQALDADRVAVSSKLCSARRHCGAASTLTARQ